MIEPHLNNVQPAEVCQACLSNHLHCPRAPQNSNALQHHGHYLDAPTRSACAPRLVVEQRALPEGVAIPESAHDAPADRNLDGFKRSRRETSREKSLRAPRSVKETC